MILIIFVFFISATNAFCVVHRHTNTSSAANFSRTIHTESWQSCVRACISEANCTHTEYQKHSSLCTLSDSEPVLVPSSRSEITTLRPVCRMPFRSPSNLPDWLPARPQLFKPVVVDKGICEVVMAESAVEFKPWPGNLTMCMRECEYDSRCGGIMYKPNSCIKASRILVSDALRPNKFVGFVKNDRTVPYYNNYCSKHETKGVCDIDRRCAWNKGKIGINQLFIVFLGYCGRVRC